MDAHRRGLGVATDGMGVSENNPSETVRKGVRVTSEASILVVSSNEIELLLDSFRLVLRLQAGAIRTFRTVSEGKFSETRTASVL